MTNLSKLSTLMLITSFFLVIGCSTNNSPLEPTMSDIPSFHESFDGSLNTESTDRSMIARYDAVIDIDNQTFIVTPSQRDVMGHFPLSNMYPNCFQITGFGFTPNFWADIKLTHPLPGSGVDAFDPRVIAILPANPGVRFIYPTLFVGGNNRVVIEPDGYTKLFDDPAVLGNVNPFIAYFKDQPYRRWSSTGQTEETKRWQMDIDGFGGAIQFSFVVDVSTNFPSPPTPVTDNAPEPVALFASAGHGLTPDGGSADITVTLLDWQGIAGIGGVRVESPALFHGTVNLSYSGPGENPNEYKASGTISNTKLAPAGIYNYMVAAWDQATGIHIYKEFPVTVSEPDTNGNLIWAKQISSSFINFSYAITTLSDDSTVVTGYFWDDTIFGEGEPNETILTSAGVADIHIARYRPDGTLLWAKRAGGETSDVARAITTLSDDSIVVAGRFFSSATFGLGEANETILTSAGDADIFIARYNPNGILLWAKRAGSTSNDFCYSIAALSNDSTVITGSFQGSAIFGQGESNETILTSAGSHDIFIARYNPDGSLAWAKRAGGSMFDYGEGITALSDDSIILAGAFQGTSIFGQGEPNQTILPSTGDFDIFIARYNCDGTLLWAKQAGGEYYDACIDITTLSDDSCVATGLFEGTAVFGAGEPNETILNTTTWDVNVFLARYNSDGTLLWAKQAGGLSSDIAYAITTLSDDSIVVTGFYRDTAIFGQGEPNETVLTSTGESEIFVARYNCDGILVWAKSAGGASFDYSYGITTLSDNSVVATGYFEETATFGPGELNQTILTSAGSRDTFIARFEP